MTNLSTPLTPHQLHAYFDHELPEEEREQVEKALVANLDAQAELNELALLQKAVVASLDASAQSLPEARFEQIWEQIDRSIEREVRLQQAAEANASIWSKLAAWMRRPIWGKGAVLVGATAALLLIVRSGISPDEATNTEPSIASKTTPVLAPPATSPTPPPSTAADVQPEKYANVEHAVADGASFPPPQLEEEAEIQRIDFGGITGRIDHAKGERGTVTVIWVVDEPTVEQSSEREL